MTKENSGGDKAEGHSEKTQQERWRECLLTVLDKIGINGETNEEKNRQIFSFVGPTGVGKTTSLAKLAAQKAVKQGKKVALITIDTFRIAAVAQLETYARIMSVPLAVVSNRSELHRAIRKHGSCDVIFIDTAGRSPNNSKDIDELKDIFKIPERIHHFLVLSATTQYENMLYAENRFNVLPFRSYIFTKLDEVEDSSPMVNFLISRPKPVSYFTTGQQVPEDIEPATKKRLAAMMLGKRHMVKAEQRNEVA
jgi:flagellar biosynthesis protein FlhF